MNFFNKVIMPELAILHSKNIRNLILPYNTLKEYNCNLNFKKNYYNVKNSIKCCEKSMDKKKYHTREQFVEKTSERKNKFWYNSTERIYWIQSSKFNQGENSISRKQLFNFTLSEQVNLSIFYYLLIKFRPPSVVFVDNSNYLQIQKNLNHSNFVNNNCLEQKCNIYSSSVYNSNLNNPIPSEINQNSKNLILSTSEFFDDLQNNKLCFSSQLPSISNFDQFNNHKYIFIYIYNKIKIILIKQT